MSGEQLQDTRLELGWTQGGLAERLGVLRGTLAHWERGRARVPGEVARAVREALRAVRTVERRMTALMMGA